MLHYCHIAIWDKIMQISQPFSSKSSDVKSSTSQFKVEFKVIKGVKIVRMIVRPKLKSNT